MYFPKVLKPRPIFFDVGDTLINFTATNPLPYFREGTKLAFEYMAGRGVKLPSFKGYLRFCRHSTYLAFVLSELRRQEVDLVNAMRRVHQLLHLPNDDAFMLDLAECFYEPIKLLGRVEEGIHEILDSFMKRGHPMAIVSNTMVPGRLLDQHLEEEDLLKYFPARIYSCDIGVKKPNSKMFRAALQALNVKPQDTIFVGDKPHLDVKGAGQLGMITVLKDRRGSILNRRYKPDYLVSRLCELPQLIEKIGPHYHDSTPTLPDDVPRRLHRVWQHLPSGPYSDKVRVPRLETVRPLLKPGP